jgi:polysaccharide export outer membrane protein
MKKYILVFVLLLSVQLLSQSDEKDNSTKFMSTGGISVTIGGDFIITGSYPASITERVDPFITRMFNNARNNIYTQLPKEPEFIEKAKKDIESYSLRNIILKRSNGEELKLDLLKFRKTGDFSQNPYLKNDDVIIFPPADLERNFFSITGAINKPGKYHFRDGDKLSDAIELAQGINKAYQNVTKAEINRLSYSGANLEVIPVDINSDYELQRGDQIVIVASETQKRDFSVKVYGEVNHPREIYITKNSTTVGDVINKAGGLTEFASTKNVRLLTGRSFRLLGEMLYGVNTDEHPELMMEKSGQVSEMIVDVEKAMMYRMSNLTLEDTSYFFLENQLRVLTEGSLLNLTKQEDLDRAVNDYDVIIVPKKQNTVYVFGQVPNIGNVSYVPGKDVFYYVNHAGGMGEYAQDEEKIMVIKAGSRQWIQPSETSVTIEEGDYIYVPRDPSYSFNYFLNVVSSYVSIVGSVATVILLMLQLNPNN